MIEDFFHLPPLSTTPVVHLELRISPRIFEKIQNGPNGILRGLGETDSWKNQKSKSHDTVPLNLIFSVFADSNKTFLEASYYSNQVLIKVRQA